MIGNGLKKVHFRGAKSLLARGKRYAHRVGLTLIVRLVKMSRKEVVAGFTIVELLTVIAILGTITAIGIPTYSGYMNKARITKAIADLTIIQKEIKLYEIDGDALPDDLADVSHRRGRQSRHHVASPHFLIGHIGRFYC